ncbi:MAG: hypothetical protein ACKVOQ_02080 [Cyclobacteriaceae bacterium]
MKAGNRNFGIADKRKIPATLWRVFPEFGGKDATEWRKHQRWWRFIHRDLKD